MTNPSFFFFFFFFFFPAAGSSHSHDLQDGPALFFFGDTYFDVGNNNYINTTTTLQANFWPYGQTFFNYPTGRYSDGRLIPDFIAEHAKRPLLLPYKHPGYNQHAGGANFASSGASALAETFQGLAINLHTQLNYFKEVERQLGGDIEAKKALLSRAIFVLSIGAADYASPFWTNKTGFIRRFSGEEYVGMVIGNLTLVIKEIHKAGGRKFGFLGVSPMGCWPMLRAVNPTNTGDDGCHEDVNALVRLHNVALSQLLRSLEGELQGFKYSLFDFYTWGLERINNPSKYGFKEGKEACCGAGPYRGFDSCGEKRGVEYQLCSNPSEYLFFDLAHPSDAAFKQLSELMWSGPPSIVWPYNLKALFELSLEDHGSDEL
ncbi:GDSL esterase/lipase 1-like isoform X4 [Diospyros lotus]|uniref:GDSL esterase/lipase 1-like isoform X4 n=1 Tax=Diospyros lotus TaxID=55363 RepID=UPI00225326B5|nr:GDSL esterase/lipase 1-like isoform X4 [Diospyros lotus]